MTNPYTYKIINTENNYLDGRLYRKDENLTNNILKRCYQYAPVLVFWQKRKGKNKKNKRVSLSVWLTKGWMLTGVTVSHVPKHTNERC